MTDTEADRIMFVFGIKDEKKKSVSCNKEWSACKNIGHCLARNKCKT